MSIVDNLIGGIIDNYLFILGGIGAIVLIRLNIEHRKKITNEYKCPNCQTSDAERVSRSFFTKMVHLNKTTKKFKCLKCWKTYYVEKTPIQTI
ncbi:MAG: hypothetical protein K9G64_07675 [Bacteroidia bacterium]|nr:hypothetical protein [Bacteroidia bacterium]